MTITNHCVLLDTSFLIRLLSEREPLHNNAISYFQYFLQHEFSLKVSTIAISEYCVKGSIDELPLRNLRILPFNYDHAIVAGIISEIVFRLKGTLPMGISPRTVVPNDSKMFAQADVDIDIDYFVSADTEAKKVYDLIKSERNLRFQYIDINTPSNIYFNELF